MSQKVKLFMGLIIHKSCSYHDVIAELTKVYGPVESETDMILFKHTAYYQKEMGTDLTRYFVSFKNLIATDDAYKTKLLSCKIESLFLVNDNRRVNIDPGILSAHNVILFSTKNYAHRIPLKENIFAELTYIYRKSQWNYLEWTYPDFKTEKYVEFLNE